MLPGILGTSLNHLSEPTQASLKHVAKMDENENNGEEMIEIRQNNNNRISPARTISNA